MTDGCDRPVEALQAAFSAAGVDERSAHDDP
jgi:hypothetical protein